MIDRSALSALELLVLEKLTPSYDRAAVPTGAHSVDFSVRITGEVRVGEDFESIIAAAVPWERIALLALSKLNAATRESVVSDAMGVAEVSSEIKAEAKAIAKRLKADTTKTKNGVVTMEVLASRVGEAERSKAAA